MTTLVTGATGHVGANLIRTLLAAGRPVRAMVRGRPIGLEGLDPRLLTTVPGDVRDPASLARAMDGVEVVLHLAAHISISGDHGGLVHAINVDGVRNVAEAALAAKVRRMVHVSSIHAFCLDEGAPLDEASPRAQHRREPAYNRSKAAGEAALRQVIERGLDATIVNPTGIIGPHDYRPSRMGRTILQLCGRSLPALVPGGFDFVDVRDIVAGILAAEAQGATGRNYILSGRWAAVDELAATCRRLTGVPSPRLTAPMWLARVGAPFVELGGKIIRREPLYTRESLEALRANRSIKNDRARSEIGYRPRPFESTIRDTIQWFVEEGALPAGLLRDRAA
ncbi:MAG: NAD-dependent epimerase/dehydratase family protein [Nannocystaceae bacterium]